MPKVAGFVIFEVLCFAVLLAFSAATSTKPVTQKADVLWSRQLVEGPSPAPRVGHSLSAIGEDRLILIGGRSVSDGWCDTVNVSQIFLTFERFKSSVFGDVQMFDRSTMQWSEIPTLKAFTARYGHSAVVWKVLCLCTAGIVCYAFLASFCVVRTSSDNF